MEERFCVDCEPLANGSSDRVWLVGAREALDEEVIGSLQIERDIANDTESVPCLGVEPRSVVSVLGLNRHVQDRLDVLFLIDHVRSFLGVAGQFCGLVAIQRETPYEKFTLN